MPAQVRVKFVGLRGIIDDLEQAAGAMGRELDDVMALFAADVADRAQSRAQGLGSVHAHVASGIVATRRGIELRVNDQPAILGAEFGGGRRPRTRQFPPYRPDGYMLYPELYNPDHPIDQQLNDMFDRLGL
jgi:hypothetical protein